MQQISDLPIETKISNLKLQIQQKKLTTIKLGGKFLPSPLMLAPLAGISGAAWRLLMEDLGAGATVSELISGNGVSYQNKRTIEMMYIDKREQNVGIQLFGERPLALAESALLAQELGAKFIDINMGCPVRKVVKKGSGAALLRRPQELYSFLEPVKKVLKIPLTIKIRLGWSASEITAAEVIRVASDLGIEWVTVHGRTVTQQYSGHANWELIEELAQNSSIPIIGNGDLHTPQDVWARLNQSKCSGLMLGRGPLKNPFLFLEGISSEGILSDCLSSNDSSLEVVLGAPTSSSRLFQLRDYWWVIKRLHKYLNETVEREAAVIVQLKKFIVWFSSGIEGAANFRGQVWKSDTANSSNNSSSLKELLELTEKFFNR